MTPRISIVVFWLTLAWSLRVGLSVGVAQRGEASSAGSRGEAWDGAASGTEADDRARRIFVLGREAYEEGRYLEAVGAFERVFVMTGHPVMLINVGNAWARLDERQRAIAAFEQYLGLVPDTPERPALERRIDRLRAYDAVVKGARTAGPGAAEPPRVVGDSSEGLLLGRTWTWVAGATSVVALGGAWLVWSGTSGDYELLARTCGGEPSGCPGVDIADVSSGVTLTNVALGVAAIAAATSVTLWFVEGPGETSVAVGVRAQPNGPGLHVTGAF